MLLSAQHAIGIIIYVWYDLSGHSSTFSRILFFDVCYFLKDNIFSKIWISWIRDCRYTSCRSTSSGSKGGEITKKCFYMRDSLYFFLDFFRKGETPFGFCHKPKTDHEIIRDIFWLYDDRFDDPWIISSTFSLCIRDTIIDRK
jgi:hypothetical protein